MKDILISTVGTTYGSGMTLGTTTIDGILATLGAGAICAFDGNGKSIVAAPASIDGDTVSFGLNTSTTDAKIVQIPRLGLAEFSYSKQIADPAVKRVTAVGYNGATAATAISNWLAAGTYVEGDEFGVIVEDTTLDVYDNNRFKRYSYVLKAIDAGAMDSALAIVILDGIIAAINADDNAKVSVARVGTTWSATVASDDLGLNFTDADFGVMTSITPYSDAGTPESADVTTSGTGNSVAFVPGFNDNTNRSQVTELERLVNVYNGRTEFCMGDAILWSQTAKSAVDNYVIYTLEWYANRTGKRNNSSNPDRQTLYICIPDGDTTVIAAIDAILAKV